MNLQEFKQRFPNASQDTIEANQCAAQPTDLERLETDDVWGVWITDLDGDNGEWMHDYDHLPWKGTQAQAKERVVKWSKAHSKFIYNAVNRTMEENAVQVNLDRKKAIPRGMNKTESEFALILEAKKQARDIDGWKYEGVRLKLAERTTYIPDFVSWEDRNLDGYPSWFLTFYEVKGAFIRSGDDGLVKFKIAREQTPWATFELWQKQKDGWKQIG